MLLADIQPYGKNAKKHPQKQIDQVAASIREFGFNQPVVVDKAGVIIVGHGRYEAAKKLGLADVPVIIVDLTEEQAKAYRLADNKLNESEWDIDLVVEELKGLSMEMLDLTGFDRDLILEDDDKDDVVPDVPLVPVSRRGELYKLGEHTLMCGDATSMDDVQKLCATIKVDIVFTDPPYNINYSGSGVNTSNTILNDHMAQPAFRQFLTDTFSCYRAVTKDGAAYYVFHSPKTQIDFETALEANGIHVINQLIWNKPSGGMGMGDYRGKHEPFFYACAADPAFYGDRTHVTIVDFQKTEKHLWDWAKKMKAIETHGKTTVWSMKRDSVIDYLHPTQKPVELIQYALTNSSKVGDVVLDLFAGSGSTLIACEKTKRSCYAMELDPCYVDVIIKRWEEYTGNIAVKMV